MITNKTIIYILSILPGLGHIAIQKRLKGYTFLALALTAFGVLYLASAQFTDYTLPLRTVFTIMMLAIPLYIWTYSDLIDELAKKDS